MNGEYIGRERHDVLVLFDVDGTLTKPRNKITDDMRKVLQQLRQKVVVGIVGGSDLSKQQEQLGDNLLSEYDFVFSENGLVAFEQGKLVATQSLKNYLGEEKLKKFINFTLRLLADQDIPIKRGTFIEFRNGMLNISPIGRNCSQEERNEFEIYDKQHNVRAQMIEKLKAEFPDFNLRYSIGGQISFDVFPEGWDKTYCLVHVRKDLFKEIHFFGDKTHPGGNDFEIFTHKDVIGHSVRTYQDTITELNRLFSLQ